MNYSLQEYIDIIKKGSSAEIKNTFPVFLEYYLKNNNNQLSLDFIMFNKTVIQHNIISAYNILYLVGQYKKDFKPYIDLLKDVDISYHNIYKNHNVLDISTSLYRIKRNDMVNYLLEQDQLKPVFHHSNNFYNDVCEAGNVTLLKELHLKGFSPTLTHSIFSNTSPDNFPDKLAIIKEILQPEDYNLKNFLFIVKNIFFNPDINMQESLTEKNMELFFNTFDITLNHPDFTEMALYEYKNLNHYFEDINKMNVLYKYGLEWDDILKKASNYTWMNDEKLLSMTFINIAHNKNLGFLDYVDKHHMDFSHYLNKDVILKEILNLFCKDQFKADIIVYKKLFDILGINTNNIEKSLDKQGFFYNKASLTKFNVLLQKELIKDSFNTGEQAVSYKKRL